MTAVERMAHPNLNEVVQFQGKEYELQFWAGKVWLHLVENKVRILQGSFVDREGAIKHLENKLEELSKYHKQIKNGVYVDVYDVLVAFNVTCPAMAHAIKKCLASGQRGHKSSIQDKKEAIESINRSIQLEQEKTND